MQMQNQNQNGINYSQMQMPNQNPNFNEMNYSQMQNQNQNGINYSQMQNQNQNGINYSQMPLQFQNQLENQIQNRNGINLTQIPLQIQNQLENQVQIKMPWSKDQVPIIKKSIGGGTMKAFIIQNAAETIEYFANIIFNKDWNGLTKTKKVRSTQSDSPQFIFLKLYHFPAEGYDTAPETQKIFYNNYILYTKSKNNCQLSNKHLKEKIFKIYGERG